MKKSLFTLIVLSLCSLLAAQFIVWRNGQIVYQSNINEVDSITLYEYKLPDTPDEPDSEPSFSLKYGDKEIQDGDVIDVTMDNYAWGELVAHLFLTNNADSEKIFTAKEVRNYDYTKYLSAFCVSACLVGNGEKEQLWSIGELASGAEQELAMHLAVASWVDGEQIFQETATCPGVFTISNGEESITFTLNFVYVNENNSNKPAYVETDQVYLLGNCKKSDLSASVFGYGDGMLHTFGGATLLPVDKLLEAGYYIVGVRVYIGNEVQSGKVFVGFDYEQPEVEKSFTYEKGGWQYVLFDAPYDFQGDTYIGFTATGTTDFLACEQGKLSKTEMINIDGQWDLVSNQLGNYVFAIQAIIASGDYSKEIQHDVVLERVVVSENIKEGDDVVLSCELRGAGIVPTENVVVKCTLGGETKTVNVSEKLMNGQSIVVNFEGLKAPSVEKAFENVSVELEADYSNDVLSTNNRSEATLCVYTSESVERNAILVEQFTGQDCPNCPGGAKVMTAAIAGLEDPSKVVWVAHHTYFVDQFSLDQSADIAEILGANFAPACNIDRMPVEYEPGTAYLIWHPGYATTDLLEELLKAPGLATIELNRTYNADTRELTVEVKGNSLMEEAYLTVILKQSGMKARQSGASSTYEHNNAPRAFLSASKGDVLTLDNGNYTKTYTYTIPEKVGEFDCVLEDMEVVAFVHGDISKDVERMVYNADQVSVIAESNNNCSIYSAQYGIDETGTIYYMFEFLTSGIEINEDATSAYGSGDDLVIIMYATPQEDGYPVAKEYPVIALEEMTDEDTECVIGGTVIQGQPIGTFAYVVEDGQAVDALLCVGGSVIFEGNATNGTMTANFEFMNTQGETVERTYIYSGKIDFEQMQMNAPARALKFNHKKFAVPFTSNK